MNALETYIVVVVHIGLLPALGFPLYYRRSAWRSTEVGKALMAKGLSIAALFGVAVLNFWWPLPGYEFVYAVVITAVVVGISYQFLVMRGLQNRDRVDRHGRF